MAFLDPKERVLDIVLTQHGRKLLSQGKLSVKYYRFFDDEVNYQTLISDAISTVVAVAENLLAENGEALLTEDGENLTVE